MIVRAPPRKTSGCRSHNESESSPKSRSFHLLRPEKGWARPAGACDLTCDRRETLVDLSQVVITLIVQCDLVGLSPPFPHEFRPGLEALTSFIPGTALRSKR